MYANNFTKVRSKLYHMYLLHTVTYINEDNISQHYVWPNLRKIMATSKCSKIVQKIRSKIKISPLTHKGSIIQSMGRIIGRFNRPI